MARLPIVPHREAAPVKDPWPVTKIYNFLGEWVLDEAPERLPLSYTLQAVRGD